MVRYSPSLGQYRGDDGKIVSRATVLGLVDEEVARMQVRLQGHARLLVQEKLTIAEFQTRMAEDMKLSHIRMTAFAAGGMESLTKEYYGLIGQALKKQYKYLHGFGEAIASGEVPALKLIKRAGSYGVSAKGIFFAAEKRTKAKEKFNQGKRTLDPQSRHCAECLKYSTGGKWVSISDIVAPGTRCTCQSRCRCQVFYRRWVDGEVKKKLLR